MDTYIVIAKDTVYFRGTYQDLVVYVTNNQTIFSNSEVLIFRTVPVQVKLSLDLVEQKTKPKRFP